MRIGLINVTYLTRVRETFKPGWRIFVTITFLLSVFFWLAGLHQLKSLAPLVEDETIRMRMLILAAAVLPPSAFALFRKNDFARLLLVLETIVNIATISLLLLLAVALIYLNSSESLQSDAAKFFAILGGLFVITIYERYLIRPCLVLLLSLMPFGRWKAYRQQVVYSLRLWSGQWKGLEEPQEAGVGVKPYLTAGARYRLALGWVSFVLGVVINGVALLGLANEEIIPAICRLELTRAWHMIRNFQPTDPGGWLDTALQATNSLLVLLLGFFFFFMFGYFWTQWQRENVVIYRVPLLQHMTPSDLLLLRSFSDDSKYVARNQSIWAAIFRVYGWSFTFEQLIVNRLRYLGRVRLIDMEQDREELLRNWGRRLIDRVRHAGLRGLLMSASPAVWYRLRKLLISVFPAVWHKLPTKGGVRYYIDAGKDEKRWQKEIEQAMSLSRVVIVLLGTSESLTWEMRRIIERPHLMEKTLFVMPPLIRKKNFRARWEQFTDFVCAAYGCERRLLEKVNPKRVLAVVVRGNTLVVISGKGNSQTFYESALDVATIFAVTDYAQSGKLIPKYLE